MPTMSRRNLTIVGVTAIAVLAVVAAANYALKSVNNLVLNAYASDWTARFVIEHLKANDCRWPTGWDDLREEYDTLAEPSHYAWTFNELQERVVLDWDVDIEAIVNADPPVTVFRLADGGTANYNGDPNVRIRDFVAEECVRPVEIEQ